MEEITENIKLLEIKENAFGIMLEEVNNEYEKHKYNNVWKDKPLELINYLKPDHSGRVGETYIHKLCNNLDISNKYVNDDTNTNDGTYDIIINKKKVEIKTARIGKSLSFQHESLRNEGCDYYLFLDIIPEYFYITILPKFDLSQKCKITNKKPHLRKGANNVYKFDFSLKSIGLAITEGYSIKIDEKSNLDDIKNFINKIII